ncbi:RICIN domain-containing protein [Streptomyces melanogenes]|uniref:RICIN domain-containing protein n=1 Tax=Streptomyces melanogenes TaxID=67326 RepID=A0ABZ1XCB7_9ACTN|nr:RICIN domain-containing protein [Streptomyces melanogenes]
MSRIIRGALAATAGLAALAGTVTAVHAADTTTNSAAAEVATVQLRATHSGQCLTIDKGSLRNGANAVQTPCADGLDSQLFEMAPTGDGTLELRPKHSGKCLEVENSGTEGGSNVQQWWCNGGGQMRWRPYLVDVVKDLYELRPAHTTAPRCLDIKGGGATEGANAQLWYCNGSAAQQWQIKPVKV